MSLPMDAFTEVSSKSIFASVQNDIVYCFKDIPGTKSDSGAPNALFPRCMFLCPST